MSPRSLSAQTRMQAERSRCKHARGLKHSHMLLAPCSLLLAPRSLLLALTSPTPTPSDEFREYYDSLQDFLKDKLSIESKHTHMYTRFREEFMEARSLQPTLGTLVSLLGSAGEADGSAPPPLSPTKPEAGSGLNAVRALSLANGDGMAATIHPISGEPVAALSLEAHGHRFGVEILIAAESTGEALRDKWIRAETVIQAQVTGSCAPSTARSSSHIYILCASRASGRSDCCIECDALTGRRILLLCARSTTLLTAQGCSPRRSRRRCASRWRAELRASASCASTLWCSRCAWGLAWTTRVRLQKRTWRFAMGSGSSWAGDSTALHHS